MFLCKIHSEKLLHVILIPPPQQLYQGLRKGSKTGKKTETFQSGKGDDSQRDGESLSTPRAHPEQRVTAQPRDQCIHSSSRQTKGCGFSCMACN